MPARVKNINPSVLKECREQMGWSTEDVEKKIRKIKEIEEGKLSPTFIQLDKLSDLYEVPAWVFISDSLPEQYQFKKAYPAFRKFADSDKEVFSNPEVRRLTTRIERLRELTLELREDMDEAIKPFAGPFADSKDSFAAAKNVRNWLEVDRALDFQEWREKLESKEIFVFMTSKYKGWSHVNRDFRGMAIYRSPLPIIVINDSDAKKAQSFTLFHELAHLLLKKDGIDDWQTDEKWCNELAGNVLMPKDELSKVIGRDIADLKEIKRIAKSFKVSLYACLVRLRVLGEISQDTYEKFEQELNKEYEEEQKKARERKGGATRNRPEEVLKQYGGIYTKSLFQAYYNKEIGLHRLCQAFDLNSTLHALKLGEML